MPGVLVIGSMNMDIVTRVARHPLPGETIHGRRTSFYSGGKGANQAIAAARAGCDVSIAGGLGHDFFGNEIMRLLSVDGINTDHICRKHEMTGVALINIDDSGENNIILSRGANGAYCEADLQGLAFDQYDAVVLQNEIPWDVNRIVIESAARERVKIYMNPAPAMCIEEQYLPMINTLIVNEIEAGVMAGTKVCSVDDAIGAARSLTDRGIEEMIVTLGTKGSVYLHRGGRQIITSIFEVDTVDTTAAGDTFIGTFIAKHLSKESIEDCLIYASAASALAVTREGAQDSIPYKEEVEKFITDRANEKSIV
jgi:ribokinase